MTTAQPSLPASEPSWSGREVTWQGIEAWSAGLDRSDAAIALVLAGTRPADLSAWRENPATPVDWRMPSLPSDPAAAMMQREAAGWVRDAPPASLVLRVREPEMAAIFQRLDSTPAVVTLVRMGPDEWARPQYGAGRSQQADPPPRAEPPTRAQHAGAVLGQVLDSAMDWLRQHPLPRLRRRGPRAAPRSAPPRPPMGRPIGEQPPVPMTPPPPPVPGAPVQVPDDSTGASPGDDVAMAPLPEAEPPGLEPDAVTEPEEVRLLQVELNAGASVSATSGQETNVLQSGDNSVGVFVGPMEVVALQAAVVTNLQLGFLEPEQETVRLTVELIPQVPAGEVMRQPLEVPRSGRSGTAGFIWHIPENRRRAQARLTLLDGVRVIQTAVLSGTVDRRATLQTLVLRSPGERPESVVRPDVSLVLNHDRSGARSVIGHREERTVIQPMPEIDEPVARIRTLLIKATQSAPRSAKAKDELLRKTLVDVAVEGRDLQGILSDFLGDLDDVKAIQVVSARPDRFMPLELLYGRPAPDDDAALCVNWIEGKECGPGCFADDDDTSVVCPSVFWGMSRIIERQHADPSVGSGIVVYAAPTGRRPKLVLAHPALGHSAKVKPADVSVTQKALGPAAAVAKDWADWVKVLNAQERDLLVLMPHTDPGAASMEIDDSWLRRGRVEARHVTGGHDVQPLVMLFGCDTGGSDDDPAGYATRFMVRQAAVVFSTLTMLLASHAAALSSQLSTLLLDQDRKAEPMGALVQRFRREALRGGLLAALAVTAYGDAEWQV